MSKERGAAMRMRVLGGGKDMNQTYLLPPRLPRPEVSRLGDHGLAAAAAAAAGYDAVAGGRGDGGVGGS